MDKNHKLNILLEGQTTSVSATCQKYNISRTIYYRWLKRYKTQGLDGLSDVKKNFVPINKTSTEIENALLNLFKTYPHYGPKAIKYLLEELGYNISESAVFNVMKRHSLTNKENRIKFSKKKERHMDVTLPSLSDLSSGECWLFWITDYGCFDSVGNIYEYTIFDFESRIACSRLYQNISLTNFEYLLTAVAIPVAQTLSFNTKFFCFFQDLNVINPNRSLLNSKISKIVQENGLDVKIHILKSNDTFAKIDELRKQYTEDCLSFLLPLINEGIPFKDIKIQFQKNIRDYNLSDKITFDIDSYSPVEYHGKLTNNRLILPLWAYIDREY